MEGAESNLIVDYTLKVGKLLYSFSYFEIVLN
jgi:hypothetical protein